MSRRLRILVTVLSLTAFLVRNASALEDCHQHHGADVVTQALPSLDDDERDVPDHSPDAPCQAPGGCVHCTIAQMPCDASDDGFTLTITCLGDVLPEALLVYTPPSTGRLIRPPR